METHATRIVVWDTPTAVECGATLRFKIGVKCAAECSSAGWRVAVRDVAGGELATAVMGGVPSPGTSALHFAAVELPAPATEGLHAWEAALVPDSSEDGPAHAPTSVGFQIRAVRAPECLLRVIAIDAASGAPVPGAKVVVHPYRSVTGVDGTAELRVPKGAYRLFVSGRDYFPFRSDGEVAADVTIRAELDVDRGPSDAELWS